MKRSCVLLVGGAAVVLLAGGCGSSDGSSGASVTTSSLAPSTSTADAAELLNVATDYADAFFSDPLGDTYDYLSAECREQWTRDDWNANVTTGVAAFESVTGVDTTDAGATVEVLNVNGSTGTVGIVYTSPDGQPLVEGAGHDVEAWFHDADGWRTDSCATADGGLGHVEAAGTSTELPADWHANYVNECLGSGVTVEECECMWSEWEQRYSKEEFIKADQALRSGVLDEEVERDLALFAALCRRATLPFPPDRP